MREVVVSSHSISFSYIHQIGDIVSVKTLIALGTNVNRHNQFNMTALDAASWLQPSDLNMARIIKDVGGMSSKEVLPQQESAGVQHMETGEETMSKGGVFSIDYSYPPTT